MQSLYNTLVRNGIQLLALALLILPLSGFTQDELLTMRSDTSSLLNEGAVSTADEFLKVDEAYLLSVDVTPATLTLHWDIAPGYYLYKDNFRIQAYSEGRTVPLELRYESGKVKYDEYFEKELEVFYGQTNIHAGIPSGVDRIQLAITSQGCADAGLCYPPHTENYAIHLSEGTATPIATHPGLAKAGPTSSTTPGVGSDSPTVPLTIGYTLLLALLGGVILNLMPCVFPVLSLKAVSLMANNGSNHNQRLHGWVYTAGAVTTFLAIGGIILGIRAAGGEADWGRQLQSPVIIALMIYLFLVMGLSLSGFVQFGTRWMGVGQSLTTRQGVQGSFFTGALAVVVASPCTAPFMAPALGVALTQPAGIALAVFAALGLGMALPFLALSYSPRLFNSMPKPGPWMNTLKQFLAFPLYLTAVWLLWVLGRQTGIDAVAAITAGAVALVFALWLAQKKKPLSRAGKSAVYTGMLAAALLALSLVINVRQFGKSELWQPYSAQLVADSRREGRPVFVNLTAAWCITCHANERLALNRESVQQKARELNVVMVKGDWTNEDPRITALMHEYQRAGVPTYLMFSPDPNTPADVLPQILTPGIVIDAMERAATLTPVAEIHPE
jgi:thiol:disulfide interchange protein